MFKSTPTKLTHSDTTSSKASSSCFFLTSCWYMPIPRCLGSILINSDRGSWTRLANDTTEKKSSVLGDKVGVLTSANYIGVQSRELFFSFRATRIN
mgnify:CR=1 FL=1